MPDHDLITILLTAARTHRLTEAGFDYHVHRFTVSFDRTSACDLLRWPA